MSEMVDRVAGKVYEQISSGFISAEQIARAAIEAMREPTEAMKRRALGAGWNGVIEDIEDAEMLAGESLYEAMIDEALKD